MTFMPCRHRCVTQRDAELHVSLRVKYPRYRPSRSNGVGEALWVAPMFLAHLGAKGRN